jgi:hypothetical protein
MTDRSIIDVTEKLSPEIRAQLLRIAADLRAIMSQEGRIDKIVLRGGAVVDLLLGRQPLDYDLFYCLKGSDNQSHPGACGCDEVTLAVSRSDLKYFKRGKIDIENSKDKEPRLNPIERTCGLLSYHTDVISMMCVDSEGGLWANKEAWIDFNSRVYNLRFAGWLPWAYYPAPTDTPNFYHFYAGCLVRGLGYVARRDLEMGDSFVEALAYLPYFLGEIEADMGSDKLRGYAAAKWVGLVPKIIEQIEDLHLANAAEVIESVRRLAA